MGVTAVDAREELQTQYSQLVGKAWADEDFKARLLEDTMGTLAQEGVRVPEGITVRVLENTGNVIHFVLPPKPRDAALSEEDLDQVAGGLQYGCCMPATGCIACNVGCYGV